MTRTHAVLWLLALLAGCAPIGVSTPQGFDERLAAGIATVSAVRTTTTTLFREEQISAEDAQHVQAQADNARENLEAARKLHASDPDAGSARLASAYSDLQALQTYLNSKRPLPRTLISW